MGKTSVLAARQRVRGRVTPWSSEWARGRRVVRGQRVGARHGRSGPTTLSLASQPRRRRPSRPTSDEELLRAATAGALRPGREGRRVRVRLDSEHALVLAPADVAELARARTIARYDVRAPASSLEGRLAHLDLARETKQVLAYAAISAALSRDRSASAFARLARRDGSRRRRPRRPRGLFVRGYRPGFLRAARFEANERGKLVTFDSAYRLGRATWWRSRPFRCETSGRRIHHRVRSRPKAWSASTRSSFSKTHPCRACCSPRFAGRFLGFNGSSRRRRPPSRPAPKTTRLYALRLLPSAPRRGSCSLDSKRACISFIFISFGVRCQLARLPRAVKSNRPAPRFARCFVAFDRFCDRIWSSKTD